MFIEVISLVLTKNSFKSGNGLVISPLLQDFLKNISDLKNRDFRFKGVKSEFFLVNNEDSLFKEENSLFTKHFTDLTPLNQKMGFFRGR